MFIGCSGSNRSVFYLYVVTSRGAIIYPLLCTCTSMREVWFLYGMGRTLQNDAVMNQCSTSKRQRSLSR